MAAKTKIIDYDLKEDTLYISARKASSSIEVGDYILDLDCKGFITGIEVLNAAENLNVSKNALSTISKVDFVIRYKPDYVAMLVKMHLPAKPQETMNLVIPVRLGHKNASEQQIAITA